MKRFILLVLMLSFVTIPCFSHSLDDHRRDWIECLGIDRNASKDMNFYWRAIQDGIDNYDSDYKELKNRNPWFNLGDDGHRLLFHWGMNNFPRYHTPLIYRVDKNLSYYYENRDNLQKLIAGDLEPNHYDYLREIAKIPNELLRCKKTEINENAQRKAFYNYTNLEIESDYKLNNKKDSNSQSSNSVSKDPIMMPKELFDFDNPDKEMLRQKTLATYINSNLMDIKNKSRLDFFNSLIKKQEIRNSKMIDATLHCFFGGQRSFRSDAAAIATLVYNIHILGDYTTPNTSPLQRVKGDNGIINDTIERGIKRIVASSDRDRISKKFRSAVIMSGIDKKQADSILQTLKDYLPQILWHERRNTFEKYGIKLLKPKVMNLYPEGNR